MLISEKLNLNKKQIELDFVNINLSKDTCLFIDPEIIAKSNDAFCRKIDQTIKSFFEVFLLLLKSGSKEKAKKMFVNLGEMNEICLGMSKGKPKGSGIGKIKAARIFDSLVNSSAVETGLMEDIEDCKLFVEGVDKDNVSDMVANIIKKHLIEYTVDQCKLLGIPLEVAPSGWYWDSEILDWDNERFCERLVIDNELYVLVPRKIVTYSSKYESRNFTSNYALTFLKNDELRLHGPLVKYRYNKEGKIIDQYVTKTSIIEREVNKYTRIDKDWLTTFCLKYREVLKNFKTDEVKSKSFYCNNNNDDVCEVIDSLISKIKTTAVGIEHATDYHRLMAGVMELLLYPALMYPKVEQPMNGGRKRIDMTFNNCAKNGFFELLGRVRDIPSPIIVFECKNYKTDVANPEIDQLGCRLNAQIGKFGIILCRQIKNNNLMMQRCIDFYKGEKKLIFCLEDKDIIWNNVKQVDNILETFQ